jgi:hypothetical protein
MLLIQSYLGWLVRHYIESPSLRLSPVRAPGVQRGEACGGLWICGRTVCEGTPAVRKGEGRGRTPRKPCNPELRTPSWGAKKRGRIGPWGRHRCSLLQSIAVACRAGDVSRRYSLPRRPFANVGVAGSSPVSCSIVNAAPPRVLACRGCVCLQRFRAGLPRISKRRGQRRTPSSQDG